jgi:hypothetical protein
MVPALMTDLIDDLPYWLSNNVYGELFYATLFSVNGPLTSVVCHHHANQLDERLFEH